MSNVLVTGGAGYIGSHNVLQLLDAGHHVVVLDNLYSGHQWAVDDRAHFELGNIADNSVVARVLADHEIESVVHFAGHIVVPESIRNPSKYYQNNVVGSFNLIRGCIDAGVNQFVFSSSAAVYGIPCSRLIDEQTPQQPINPYGASKLMTEWTLRDLSYAVGDFRYVALRYFNVAGAHSSGRLGQTTPEATHLIKVACQVATGKYPKLPIFGDDYDTEDGTCVRDYIHIQDLANAHVDALRYLSEGGESNIFNCGYGKGYSVREVVECVKKVSGVDFQVDQKTRRPGDPDQLVADNTRIRETLGWIPDRDDLSLICRSAFEWEQKVEQFIDCPRCSVQALA